MNIKKVINIVLTLSVIIIWSLVVYKFFTNSEVSTPQNFELKPLDQNIVFDFKKSEKELVLSDKNPFNRTQPKRKIPKKKTPNVALKKKSEEIKEIETKPNFISYHGSITDHSGNKVYVIKLNKQLKRFKTGQKIGNVTLLKTIENGIIVLDGEEEREILESQ